MKRWYLIMMFFSLFPLLASAGNDVKLNCEMLNCRSTHKTPLKLFRFTGVLFEEVQTSVKEENTYRFLLEDIEGPDYYYLGFSSSTVKPILLGSEDSVHVRTNCDNVRVAYFEKGSLNEQYESMTDEIKRLSRAQTQVTNNYRKALMSESPPTPDEYQKKYYQIRVKRMVLVDSMKTQNPFLGKVAAAMIHVIPEGKSNSNRLEYISLAYMGHADLSDKEYNHIAAVYEGFKAYTRALLNVDLTPALQTVYIDKKLNRIEKGSSAHQYALGGILSSLERKAHPNYEKYANEYIEHYKESEERSVEAISKKLDSFNKVKIGGEAPDFTLKTPEGEELSLSDLNGKVVLIDFWASWCRPCRKANPQLVNLYNTYKDQGLEILGVSLDRKKDAWIKAIEQDKLAWHHVSDLRGWQNEVAQMYLVKSIPDAILLDREGKIVGRKLKGAKLSAELQKIFSD